MAVTRVGTLSAALLSIISYYDEANQPAQKVRMQKALASIQAPVNGPWALTWGPAVNDGVLAFVARGADGRYALALRGTLTDWDAKGLFDNILEDLDALVLVPFLYPQSANANVAAGSNAALALLVAATDPATDLSLIDYLRQTAAAQGGKLVLDVVGHSLGGDLANLAAAWLADQLPKAAKLQLTLTPYTFAAPTTGDQGFANLWNTLFGTSSYACVNAQRHRADGLEPALDGAEHLRPAERADPVGLQRDAVGHRRHRRGILANRFDRVRAGHAQQRRRLHRPGVPAPVHLGRLRRPTARPHLGLRPPRLVRLGRRPERHAAAGRCGRRLSRGTSCLRR